MSIELLYFVEKSRASANTFSSELWRGKHLFYLLLFPKCLNVGNAISLIASSRFLIGFLQERISWINIQVITLFFAFMTTLTVLSLTNYQNQYVQEQSVLLACCFSGVGFFFGSVYPTICSIILNYLPKVLHSTMSGLMVIFSEIGISVGILTIGFLAKNFSLHNAFYFMLLPISILPFLLIVYHNLMKSSQSCNV